MFERRRRRCLCTKVATDWDVELDDPLEDEEVLEEEDGETSSVVKYEQAQRELVLSVVDYNLDSLAEKVKKKQIDLAPKFQRRFRWDAVRQSRLIESFLMNVPIPPVFLNEDRYGHCSVIDGKQRIQAVADFMAGRLRLTGLRVFPEVDGRAFGELDPELQTVLVTRPTIRATIILRQSHPDIKYAVFHRLNTGGVRLNAQEIRNSVYPGPLNDAILELSEAAEFHKMLGIRKREESAIYKTMRDCELVVRYFAFKDTWQTFSGGIAQTLDRYMNDHKEMKKPAIGKLRASFLDTLEVVKSAFGAEAFRRWNPKTQHWGKQPLAAMFDAQMFACYQRSDLSAQKAKILKGMQKLFESKEFVDTVNGATNTPSSFRKRIQSVTDLLDSVS